MDPTVHPAPYCPSGDTQHPSDLHQGPTSCLVDPRPVWWTHFLSGGRTSSLVDALPLWWTHVLSGGPTSCLVALLPLWWPLLPVWWTYFLSGGCTSCLVDPLPVSWTHFLSGTRLFSINYQSCEFFSGETSSFKITLPLYLTQWGFGLFLS